MPTRRTAALSAALMLLSACGGRAPTAPSASPPGTRLALVCGAPTLLAGDVVVCTATVGLVNVGLSESAVWTSSDPNIAASLGIGLFMGKSDGQATLTVTYSGQTVSAPLTVDLQDVLRASAAAFGGTFKIGTTATMWLQGFYGVASADSGTLTLVVTDQTGATVSTSEPLTVPHGGDRYILSTTFTLPPGTTRVCRKGVLQIGSTTLTVIPVDALVPCVAVTP
jgi:hypothetical protein